MRRALVLLGFLPASLVAHHSFVDYDTNDIVEIEGELTEVRWRNPHPSMHWSGAALTPIPLPLETRCESRGGDPEAVPTQ